MIDYIIGAFFLIIGLFIIFLIYKKYLAPGILIKSPTGKPEIDNANAISVTKKQNNKPVNNSKTNKKLSSPKKKNKKKKKMDEVYLTISIDNNIAGNIIIKLFDNVVPKTCNNFRILCENKDYRGCPFHRVIKDFMIQGGDYTNHNGTGGGSIYGEKFEDENFDIPNSKYFLSMANSGPDTNGSQFFINTTDNAHLNGKHVVFAQIIDGFDLVDHINNIDTGNNDRPNNNIIISDCGIN